MYSQHSAIEMARWRCVDSNTSDLGTWRLVSVWYAVSIDPERNTALPDVDSYEAPQPSASWRRRREIS